MESDLVYLTALFVGLLLFSAFFSGSETALFSLSRLAIQKLVDEKKQAAQTIERLLKAPQRLLITILFGNTLVNVFIASLAASLAAQVCRQYHYRELVGLVIEVVVVTVVILIFGEITPKVLAIQRAEKVALRVSRPVVWCTYLFWPVTFFLTGITRLVTRALGQRHPGPYVTEDEIKTLIDMGEDSGTIEEDEKQMLDSLFTFSDTSVTEIMVPRIDMAVIEDEASLADALHLIRQTGYSRIPVYRGTVDHIEKVLYAKDLLPYLDSPTVPVHQIARPAYVIPSTKKIDDLLKEFRREKLHLAIVVDEYGGTAGMVTLEDVLEEIVGEIQDEYDEEKPLYSWLAPQTLLVNARIDLQDLSELIDTPLPEDGYETLAGLIFALIERMPAEKEEITYRGLTFIIEKVHKHRITSVKIQLPEPLPPAEDFRED